jgi:3-dehydroquinate synthase
MGLCGPQLPERLKQLLSTLGLPITLRGQVDGVRDALLMDKKVLAGRSRFILVEDLGKISIRDDVPSQLIEDVVAEGLNARALSREEVPIRAT